MGAPRELDEAGAGHPRRDVAALLDLGVSIAAAMEHQGWDGDRREDAANVDLAVHQDQVARRARARGRPGAPKPPVGERLIRICAHPRSVCLGAPVALDLGRVGLALLPGRRPRIVVVRIAPLRIGGVEHERRHALGIRGREEAAHRASLRVAEERRELAADGVQHRANVVHARLEIGKSDRPIRETGAALVEQDQPRERGEAPEQVGIARLLPVDVEVGDESGDEHEVERPLAHDLEGDVDLAVSRLGEHRLLLWLRR